MFNCSQNEIHFPEGTVLTRGEVCISHFVNHVFSRSSLNTDDIEEDEIVTDEDNKTEVLTLVNEFKDVVSKTTSQIGMTDKVVSPILLVRKSQVSSNYA